MQHCSVASKCLTELFTVFIAENISKKLEMDSVLIKNYLEKFLFLQDGL